MGTVALIDIIDIRNSNDKENIGICIIAAYLRSKGITVDLFSFTTIQSSTDIKLEKLYGYDIYGFSIYPNTANEVFEYAKEIKDKNKKCSIFVGGVLATVAAKEILEDCKYIDFVVLGYGEEPLFNVINSMEYSRSINSIPSIFTRENSDVKGEIKYIDSNKMPWPARDYLVESIKSGNYTARLNTSLGCYGSCVFCSVNSYCHGEKRWSGRNMRDVFDEIIKVNEEFGIKSFVFNDASFEDPPNEIGRNRINELCNLLLNYPSRFAFRISMRAETFNDQDGMLLRLMRNTGFTHVFLGIESGSQHDLKIYNKRATVKDNERALQLFNKYDIDVTMGFIMINPFSNKESVNENYQFLRKHKAARMDMFTRNVDAYFLTSMHYKLKDAGLLTKEFSYRNPYGYVYADKDIQNLEKFLELIREDTILSQQDGKVLQMAYVLSSLKAIYGGAVESYSEEFKKINNKIANIMADYFGILFEDFNIKEASVKFEEFKLKLRKIYGELDTLTLRMLYNHTFREFFFISS